MPKTRYAVTITLSEDVIKAMNGLSRSQLKNKSELINSLLYNYISCSFSGSLL